VRERERREREREEERGRERKREREKRGERERHQWTLTQLMIRPINWVFYVARRVSHHPVSFPTPACPYYLPPAAVLPLTCPETRL
jgi:hypothetical protein